MRDLYDLTYDELAAELGRMGEPAFRAGQVYQWLGRGAGDWPAMTNLPASLRERLSRTFRLDGLRLSERRVSAIDGTIKCAFLLQDGNLVESVLMRYRHGYSICLSSQAGCRMGCAFCASARAGFGRSLTSGEMLQQVVRFAAMEGVPVHHAVVMGIGEPLDNYTELVRFLRCLNDPRGFGMGLRHVSVSTCGLVDKMINFTDEGLPVTLSVSLHAPNDGIRRRLMPIAARWTMDELLEACRRHTRVTGRRVTFEYALFDGVNDRPEHAEELAERIRGMLAHVNLIPANELESGGLKQSSGNAVRRFQDILAARGIQVTVRRELGSDIMAACGQLRRRLEEAKDD